MLTFKQTYLQTYYSWLNHSAPLSSSLSSRIGLKGRADEPVYSRLFQDLSNMYRRNQYLCLHFWDSLYLVQLFFNSNCNIFYCNFFSVQRWYNNVNSVSSPVLSVSLQIVYCTILHWTLQLQNLEFSEN